jgi:D-psicose/D-tagatose/L-ribulose 3-epimerase
MYPIGINTFLFTSSFTNDSAQLFAAFADWGFDTVEIAAENPLLLNDSIIKAALKKNNLRCVSVAAAFGAERDFRGNFIQQQNSLQYIKDIIDFTKQVGGEMVVGPLYSRLGRADAISAVEYELQEKIVVGHLKELCKYSAAKKIKLAIEPLNRYETDFINTCEQGLNLIEKVGSDWLYLHLDTFHMNIEEKHLGEAIIKAGDQLCLLHACGSDRGTPGWDHTNWNDIKRALETINYKGQLVIESFTPDVKLIAKAASIWRTIDDSGETIAREGLKFLRGKFGYAE